MAGDDRVATAMETAAGEIVEELIARYFAANPDLDERYGAPAREKCRQDAHYHIQHLGAAIRANEPVIFSDYVGWAKVLLARRNVPSEDLADFLTALAEVLQHRLPADAHTVARGFLAGGIAQLPTLPADLASELDRATDPALAARYLDTLLGYDVGAAINLVDNAVAGGLAVEDIYLEVLQPALREIGRRWQLNEVSVAQEHFVSAATQVVMSRLLPLVFRVGRKRRTMVAACVGGEQHEIGVRMVADLFALAGWRALYIGASTPVADLVAVLEDARADLLALSATMSYRIASLAELVRAVRSCPACGNTKILVGGRPFLLSSGLWRFVGADGSASDAREALKEADRLLGAQP